MEMDKSRKSSPKRISGGKKAEVVSRGADDLENDEYNASDMNLSRKQKSLYINIQQRESLRINNFEKAVSSHKKTTSPNVTK